MNLVFIQQRKEERKRRGYYAFVYYVLEDRIVLYPTEEPQNTIYFHSSCIYTISFMCQLTLHKYLSFLMLHVEFSRRITQRLLLFVRCFCNLSRIVFVNVRIRVHLNRKISHNDYCLIYIKQFNSDEEIYDNFNKTYIKSSNFPLPVKCKI